MTTVEIVGTIVGLFVVIVGPIYAYARSYGEIKTRQDALDVRLNELRDLCLTLLAWGLGVQGEPR